MTTRPRDAGFALIIVLWTMGSMALLVALFTGAARTELRVTMNLQANAVAQAAADGAVHETVLRLLANAWRPDGQPRLLPVGRTIVTVQVKSLAQKINPNVVPPVVLGALLIRLGVDPGQALALAQAIVDWRSLEFASPSGASKRAPYIAARLPYGPANRGFDSVEEIGLVIGMTPDLLVRMKPYLSIHQEGEAADESGDPVTAASEDAPQGASAGWQLGSTGQVMVVSIEAAAPGGFIRQATIRLRLDPAADRAAYEILTWGTVSR
jgi:general secretion pathway protein K